MTGFENSSIINLNGTSSDSFDEALFEICILCFHLVFGPPVHIYVLWLIVTGKKIESEFLNFQLSVSEMMICVNSFLMLLRHWFMGIEASLSFLMGLTVMSRPLFQCLICVERYLAVVHPVTFLKYKPLRYKLFFSALAWCVVLGSCLFSRFTSVTQALVYRFGLLLQFLLFFSVNLFCCLAVLWALKKPGPGDRGTEREEENHMKRRAFYLILITTVSMVVMYEPVICSVFFLLLLSYDSFIFTFSLLCFILAGFVQPVLFLIRVGKLNFLFLLLKCKCFTR